MSSQSDPVYQTASQRALGYQDDSYDAYAASLKPCPGCGRVDEMDNIEGRSLCAACSLDEMSDDDDGFWDEDEELRS